jgi:predicted cobalt transporter CbtA
MARWTGWLAAGLLAAYAIVGLVSLLGGPYAFEPSANPENLFHQEHWLADLDPTAVGVAMVIIYFRTAGPCRRCGPRTRAL